MRLRRYKCRFIVMQPHLSGMPAIKVHDLRRQRTALAMVIFLWVSFGILWWAQFVGDPAYRPAGPKEPSPWA